MNELEKHMVEKHNRNPQRLHIRVSQTCPRNTMLRQVTEGTYINEQGPRLNMKEEWGNLNIGRQEKRKTIHTEKTTINKYYI